MHIHSSHLIYNGRDAVLLFVFAKDFLVECFVFFHRRCTTIGGEYRNATFFRMFSECINLTFLDETITKMDG